jgi:predicted small secreted protein
MMNQTKPFAVTGPVDRIARDSGTRIAVLRSACGLVIAGVAIFAALTLPACRTTEGLGRDVEALGDNVADSADKHKP